MVQRGQLSPGELLYESEIYQVFIWDKLDILFTLLHPDVLPFARF